jgi:hypothetical protein
MDGSIILKSISTKYVKSENALMRFLYPTTVIVVGGGGVAAAAL